MKKRPDIKNKSDIEKLVNLFYDEVKEDEILSHFFYRVNWERHLPVMVTFWENVLFYTGTYSGNPMEKHKYLHEQMVMTKAHFSHWLQLFNKAVDHLYAGPKAEMIKEKAHNIATVMQIKILV